MSRQLLAAALAAAGLMFAPAAQSQEAADPPVAENATEPSPAEAPASVEPPGATVTTPPASTPPMSVAEVIEGIVSYYGQEFAGRRTASGERFDPNQLTMAHKTLPFGTLVRVTNLHNNQSVVLRVNDRGPFVGGRVGDVSAGAARLLMMLQTGLTRARLEILRITQGQAAR
jgi:rare lipoprotein A